MEKYLGAYMITIGILAILTGLGIIKIKAIENKVPKDRKVFISLSGLILLIAGLLYTFL